MSQQSLMGLMDDLLKQAKHEEKRALSDISGPEPTTHPVMQADPGTKPATEGERSSENESDVRGELGEAGITGQEDANSADALEKDEADDIGTQTSDSEEMAGNVQQPKATKDAPPDKGPGDETFSEKYSAAAIVESGNKLLAALGNLTGQHKQASEDEGEKKGGEEKEAEKGKKKPCPPESGNCAKKAEDAADPAEEEAEKRAAAEKYSEDAEAGYVAAQMIANQLFDKKAEDEKAAAIAENIIKTAHADAELLHEYLLGREKGADATASIKKAGMKKRAMPGMIPPEAMAGAGPEMGGGIPPEMGGGLPPEMGGAGGEMPPEMGAGGGEEEALDALAEALAEANVTPEELAATIAEAQAEAGGAPGEEAEMIGEGAGEAEEAGEELGAEEEVGEEAGEEVAEEAEEEAEEEVAEKGAALKKSLKGVLQNIVKG